MGDRISTINSGSSSIVHGLSSAELMNLITPPSRSTFWRVILIVIAALSFLSILDLISRPRKNLDVNLLNQTSHGWLGSPRLPRQPCSLYWGWRSVYKSGEQLWGRIEALGFTQKSFGIVLIVLALIGLPACRVQFIFQNRVGKRGLDSSAHLLDVQSRGHVGRKNFSQRNLVVNRVDRFHVVSIGFANSAHQHSIGHGVSVRDGLVGDEPLLLSVAVSLAKNIRRTICVTDPSPNIARVARAAVSVRRAVVVPSFLANVLAARVGRVDRARVDE
jgi:hypothetical protein